MITIKSEDERIVQMIVLQPEIVDSQGDIVSEDEIKNAMHLWMEHYRNIGIQHKGTDQIPFPMSEGILSPDDKAWEKAYKEEFSIIECFQSPVDYKINGEEVCKGSWVLGLRVNDDEAWHKIKRGQLTGASIGGHAIAVEEN